MIFFFNLKVERQYGIIEFLRLEKTFEIMESNQTPGKCQSFQVDVVYGMFPLIFLYIFWAEGFLQLLKQCSARVASQLTQAALGLMDNSFFLDCPLK